MGDNINRRNFLLKTAEAAGTAGALGGATLAAAQTLPPQGFADQPPFAERWEKPLRDIVSVPPAPELDSEAVKERHRIYCYLLMALIQRFWNGNKHGPMGIYPGRANQKEPNQAPNAAVFRYRGDTATTNDPLRVSWDRYVGHNIACLAVEENGEIIDFEFNHNDFFRSSAEHAEARMVRRLFSLTDDFDTWKDRSKAGDQKPTKTKSSKILLDRVTLYTSLESCAQCSGVMSLARVKRVIYLQNDFTAYMIGNIMFNLAGPGVSPRPIPASDIGLAEFDELNAANLAFGRNMSDAAKRKDALGGAFFVPPLSDAQSRPDVDNADFSPSITSFLCTDVAYDIFSKGTAKLTNVPLQFPGEKLAIEGSLTNQQCLDEARRFFTYADIEGFRGSPHRP